MKAFLAAVILLGLAPVAAAQTLRPMPVPDSSCAPVNGLSFVCGPRHPEDAIPIPGTRWLIVSGQTPGYGLAAIDRNAKTAYFLYGADSAKAPDRRYPGCAAAPDPASLPVQGISLRPSAPGRYTLYAVSHGTPESVQIFDLDARGDAPALAWKGCVALPDKLRANSVVSFANGSILITVQNGVGSTNTADAFLGKPTGAVFAWSPGEPMFHQMKGTELPSPNGLELAPDETEFYVVSTNTQSLHVFSRDGRELRAAKTPGFNPDNIRWNGNRLISAGMITDEPACGGIRRALNGVVANGDCHRGYMVAEVDPVSLKWTMVAYGEPNPVFDAVATGALVGDTLWLSSYKIDRVAYRPLPGLPPR